MIDSARLKTRMEDCRLSQAELARRVKVSQQTIYKLIHGEARGSKHLHRIARVLSTTPAYLTGEVDDPDQVSPEQPTLSYEQEQWLALFDVLDGPKRAALAQVAEVMRTDPVRRHSSATEGADAAIEQRAPASSYQEFTLPVLFPPEFALTRMFEALLAMVDPEAPTEVQAQSLAKNLPIGLSQLRDILPPPPPDGGAGASSDQSKTLVEQQ